MSQSLQTCGWAWTVLKGNSFAQTCQKLIVIQTFSKPKVYHSNIWLYLTLMCFIQTRQSKRTGTNGVWSIAPVANVICFGQCQFSPFCICYMANVSTYFTEGEKIFRKPDTQKHLKFENLFKIAYFILEILRRVNYIPCILSQRNWFYFIIIHIKYVAVGVLAFIFHDCKYDNCMIAF